MCCRGQTGEGRKGRGCFTGARGVLPRAVWSREGHQGSCARDCEPPGEGTKARPFHAQTRRPLWHGAGSSISIRLLCDGAYPAAWGRFKYGLRAVRVCAAAVKRERPLSEGAPGCKCVQRLCMLPASGVPIAGKTVGQLSRREGVMKGCRKRFFDTPVRPNAAGRGVFISRFWNRCRARRARVGRAAA